MNNFGVNVNGSSAKSDGVEFTATARPVPGLELSANGAYTNARLTRATPDVVGGRKGDQLPFTPKFSAALNADYGWNLGGDARAHVGASLRHLSGQTANYDLDFVTAFGRQRHVRPYNVIDLNAGVTFGRFDVEAYVEESGQQPWRDLDDGTTVLARPIPVSRSFPMARSAPASSGRARSG